MNLIRTEIRAGSVRSLFRSSTHDPLVARLLAIACCRLFRPLRQDSKPAGVPATSNNRDAPYPRILDDLRVTFRLRAARSTEINSASSITSVIPPQRARMVSGPRRPNLKCLDSTTIAYSLTAPR